MKTDISNLVQMVLDGEVDPLEAYAELKSIEQHVQSGIKEIKDAALAQAEYFKEKSFEHKGVKFTKTDGKAIYSFKHIEGWVSADSERKRIESLCKQAYSAYTSGSTMIDDDGQEVPLPEVKYTEPTLSVKI